MIYKLFDDLANLHERLQIRDLSSNGVVVFETDWRVIQGRLYLVLVPGLCGSMLPGIENSVEECYRELA